MSKHKLKEIFDLQMGKTPARAIPEYWNDGENDWVSIADLSTFSKYVGTTKENITEMGVRKSGIKSVPADTVIMSFKLSLGKVAITTCPVYTNEAIMAFIDRCVVEIIPDYIYYLFSSMDWAKGTNKAVKGTTLNKATLGEYEIVIPSVAVQKNIIAILDKANELIAERKRQLEQLDLMVKSRFVEMFGDPETNPMGWEVKQLGELGELNRGISKHRPRNAPELLNGAYPLVQTGEVANADLYINSYSATYSELGLKQSKMWPQGTLCITIAANIAKTAILGIDACFPDSVVGFIAREKTNVFYIHYWFSFFQQVLEEQAPESAQKNINLRILNALEVITPSLPLQNRFADFVRQVDKSKFEIQQGLKQLELQYAALMQQYFG
jgi:type I restriction enzyme S subunit